MSEGTTIWGRMVVAYGADQRYTIIWADVPIDRVYQDHKSSDFRHLFVDLPEHPGIWSALVFCRIYDTGELEYLANSWQLLFQLEAFRYLSGQLRPATSGEAER